MSGDKKLETISVKDAFENIQDFIFESATRLSNNEYLKLMNSIKILYDNIVDDDDQDDDQYYIYANRHRIQRDNTDDDTDDDIDDNDEEQIPHICNCTSFMSIMCKSNNRNIVNCNVFSNMITELPLLEIIRCNVLNIPCDKIFNLQQAIDEYQINISNISEITEYLNKTRDILCLVDNFNRLGRFIVMISCINHYIKIVRSLDMSIAKYRAFVASIIKKIDESNNDDNISFYNENVRKYFNCDLPLTYWSNQFQQDNM